VLGFAGRDIPTVKVNRLLLGNTSVLGVGVAEFWRARPEFAAEQWRELVPLMDSGALDPPISRVFPLSDAAAALSFIDQRLAAGKVLLRVRED
jgi:NADPH2:quinone reductase